MRPLSAVNYIRENPKRSLIIIFLLVLTTMMFPAGNYVSSVRYFTEQNVRYYDKMFVVSAIPTDEDLSDFTAIYQDLQKNEKLIVQERSPKGYSGIVFECTMGFDMGSGSMVFNSPEDLKEAFDIFGIREDLSDVKDGTVCISAPLAASYGLNKGDLLDASVLEGFKGSFPIAAVIHDESYIAYYVADDGYDFKARVNVLSRELKGRELYEEICRVAAGRKAEISRLLLENSEKEFAPYRLIFGAGMLILSVILSVCINAVLSGQFLYRRYEFGLYRALGFSKEKILRKVAEEMLVMDLIAVILGAVLIFLFSFLINELYYIPDGKYLPYVSDLGVYGFLISNALVMLPAVLWKGLGMSRSEVTQF